MEDDRDQLETELINQNSLVLKTSFDKIVPHPNSREEFNKTNDSKFDAQYLKSSAEKVSRGENPSQMLSDHGISLDEVSPVNHTQLVEQSK